MSGQSSEEAIEKTIKIIHNGTEIELPLVIGTEKEIGIDIATLRASTKLITLDPGYGNTGSCKSEITFINGEKGILRYRGYPIEELANNCSFLEVCYLVIYGELPNKEELKSFEKTISMHTLLHQDMLKFFEGFPPNAHPMAVMQAMIASMGAYYPDASLNDDVHLNIIRLIAKTKTIAAFSYKKSIGQPYIYPDNSLDYVGDFLRMMYAVPTEEYKLDESHKMLTSILNLILILHIDHEQNCSTSAVRMVGSSQANLFATISAGVSALSGPLHGLANQKVLQMLEQIHESGDPVSKWVEKAKDKASGFRLMGFGHRVYKFFDPRAEILKKSAISLLPELGIKDPLLDIAMELEQAALNDEYFKERNLYPNVDFYSGVLYAALGIPTDMFTVMFTMGRVAGWISQWKEQMETPGGRIHRPRQVYIGETKRDFVELDKR